MARFSKSGKARKLSLQCADCARTTDKVLFDERLCNGCGERRVARETQGLLLDGELGVRGWRGGSPLYVVIEYPNEIDHELTQAARLAASRGHAIRLISGRIVEVPLYGATDIWWEKPWRR